MIKLKELITKLRKENNEKILALKTDPNADATKVAEYAKYDNDLSELDKEYDKLLETNAKYKDTILSMVTDQGSKDVPVPPTEENKPKSLQELFAEAEAKQAQLDKGGN